MKKSRTISNKFKMAAAAAILAVPLAFSSSVQAEDEAPTVPETHESGLDVGPIHFGNPSMLFGLGVLPALWWLLRSVPQKPREEDFPAIRFLFNKSSDEQRPERMPWWQRQIALTAAALAITGTALPELNPQAPFEGGGPVMLVVDNGWASAPHWKERTQEMEALIDRAEQESRPVILLPTAMPEDGGAILPYGPMDARSARKKMQEFKPVPWAADRKAALEALQVENGLKDQKATSVIWLSNGLDDADSLDLKKDLQARGSLTLVRDEPDKMPYLLASPESSPESLSVKVQRTKAGEDKTLSLIASDEQGQPITVLEVSFDKEEVETRAVFDLPSELRNQITSISIEGERSAGATILIDERWRRRPVGLVSSTALNANASLLEEASYIREALSPYTDFSQGSLGELLSKSLSVLVMTDDLLMGDKDRERISEWVKEGGTLLRFAGPHFAAQNHDNDELLPVDIYGERNTSGSLSGEYKAKLAPFGPESPFYGIKLSDEVIVEHQILAEPDIDSEGQVWASLDDGTPLVTARALGNGRTILVHTMAKPGWSNMVLSGMFVDMMRTVVETSQGLSGDTASVNSSLSPLQVLNGEGELTVPSSAVKALEKKARVGPENPPGYYGTENARRAHNLYSSVETLKPLSFEGGYKSAYYQELHKSKDLAGYAWLGAMTFLLLDLLVVLGQQGYLPGINRDAKTTGPAKKGTAPRNIG